MNNLLKIFLIFIVVTFVFSLRLFVYADHDIGGPKGPYIIYFTKGAGVTRGINPIYDVDFKRMEGNTRKYNIALNLCKKSNEYLAISKNIPKNEILNSKKISSEIKKEFLLVDPELTTNVKLCNEVWRFFPRSSNEVGAGKNLVENYYPYCSTIISFFKCHQDLEERFSQRLNWLVNTKHKNFNKNKISELLSELKNLNSKTQEIKTLPKGTLATDI